MSLNQVFAHNNLHHVYSPIEVVEIEKDMKQWIEDQRQRKLLEVDKKPIEITMETVYGLSYAKGKEGVPFEHMAIQVGDDYYYHLVFQYDENYNEPVGVKFQRDLIENIHRKCETSVIGKTIYTSNEIMKIGKYLITIFGAYYKVFWNCQHFARILTSVLTDGEYDSSFFETTDKFIAGFLFRLPFTGSLTALSILKPSKKRKNHMMNKVSHEYKDILTFELDVIHHHNKKTLENVSASEKKLIPNLSKSWIMN
jgi:hypothetical protein